MKAPVGSGLEIRAHGAATDSRNFLVGRCTDDPRKTRVDSSFKERAD